MDCSFSDGTKRYLAPSESGNMWCTSQVDMTNFAAWCYKTTPTNAKEVMDQLKDKL
jgi:hypothetical protein